MRKPSLYSQGDNGNANHPWGLYTNTQGGVDGTATDANQINDPMYALFAVLNKAGITPNNNLESVANSQFLQALTELFENNMPYKAGKTYNVGDTFTIGGVTHIVIPENNATTTKFSDAVGAFAGLTSAQETALSNKRTGYITSLKAGYERFRAEAVPLHLYEKGISSPVVDGINLTDKYPKFFANCNGLNASGQYNTSRKAFIDDNLQYLVTGGVYKTFDVPQGFGLVNNHNSMGTTTGGGDIADINKHALLGHTHFDGMVASNAFGEASHKILSISSPINQGYGDKHNPDFVFKGGDQNTSNLDDFLKADWALELFQSDASNPKEGQINFPPAGTSSGNVVKTHYTGQWAGAIAQKYTGGGGYINNQHFNDFPNTGAGLQLGCYTLLKMV